MQMFKKKTDLCSAVFSSEDILNGQMLIGVFVLLCNWFEEKCVRPQKRRETGLLCESKHHKQAS